MATRPIVGGSMSNSLASEIALNALEMARTRQPLQSEAVFHSVRGGQYTSGAFRARLANMDLKQSMSRKANGWDKAPAESFFATLKREAFETPVLKNHNEARQPIFEYIEGYYHSNGPIRPSTTRLLTKLRCAIKTNALLRHSFSGNSDQLHFYYKPNIQAASGLRLDCSYLIEGYIRLTASLRSPAHRHQSGITRLHPNTATGCVKGMFLLRGFAVDAFFNLLS